MKESKESTASLMAILKRHEARYIRKMCLGDYMIALPDDYYVKAYNNVSKGLLGVIVGRYGHQEADYFLTAPEKNEWI